MNKTLKIFYGCWAIAIIATMADANAATTARPTLANTSANRIASTATRTSSTASGAQSTTTVATKAPEPVVTNPEPEPEKVIIVDNKTSMFDDILAEIGVAATDSSANELAETIRRQRALLDAQSERDTATGATSGITTANACDRALRDCMTEKCGQNFTKCNKDSTTAWGNKMDSCRRQTKCTGHEYTLLAPEILADRNAYNELAYYQSVVNCGNKYNDCIFTICGTTLDKCLSKSAGDSAIAKCKSIADECKEQDSGIAARVMDVFGDNRKIAATEAQKQEKRLYELRDLMRAQCQRFGAMFDERTLDCVYTVNFFVDKISSDNPTASKKLYAGQTFQCTPNWFGIDITTYLENAQRLTRSQTGAAAAAAGAGIGTAAGLWSSGAVTRAMDTQKAAKQAKDACEAEGGGWVSAAFNQGKKCDMTNAQKNCIDRGGTWNDETGCTKTNSSNGGGSNPGENGNMYPQGTISGTLCEQYTQEQCEKATAYCQYKDGKCIANAEIQKSNLICNARTQIDCENGDGKCKFVNQQCISASDAINPEQMTQNIICNKKKKESCNGNCQWDENANNGKGQCVAKTDSSTGGGSNQEKTQKGKKSGTPYSAAPTQTINASVEKNITNACKAYCTQFVKNFEPNTVKNLEKIACKDACKSEIESKCQQFATDNKTSELKESCSRDTNGTCNYTCKTTPKAKESIQCDALTTPQECLLHASECSWNSDTGCKKKMTK